MSCLLLIPHNTTSTGCGVMTMSGHLFALSDCCGDLYVERRCRVCDRPAPMNERRTRLWIPNCNELFIQQWIEDWTGLKDVRVQINA